MRSANTSFFDPQQATASNRLTCSDAELDTRVELSSLYRAAAHYGMTDLANGAIGARVPDAHDHFLTHPYGMFWEEICASDFITVDGNGQPTDPNAPWLNDGAVNLCRWIFQARPEVNFFVHGHDSEVMAVGSVEGGLLPLNQPAIYLGNLLTYIEYEFDEDEDFGTHFAQTLSDKQIMISHNHGYYCLGETAAAAFIRAFFLKQACDVQVKTLSMGRPLHEIDPQKVARYQDQMAASPHYHYDGKTEWPGLLRMLDRTQPLYRT